MDEAFEQAIREQAEAKTDDAPSRDSTVSSIASSLDDNLVTSCQNRVFGGEYPQDIRKKYHLMDDVLGEGSFGTVRKCRRIGSKEVFALKTIDKSKLPDATQLRREVDILLDVDHPHIIKLYDVFEDETHIYLVSELCTGGELYDAVVEKSRSKEGHFTEFTAARIIRNILSAISYCHDVKKIVHRDLVSAKLDFQYGVWWKTDDISFSRRILTNDCFFHSHPIYRNPKTFCSQTRQTMLK